MMISAWTLLVYALYLAGLIAFGVFYIMEEGTTKAYVGIFAVIVVVVLLGVMQRLFFAGAMVAGTFYVVDRKNRSRGWAIPAILFGPIVLFIVVLLPKQAADSTLSLHQ
jgi:hypothetical protein